MEIEGKAIQKVSRSLSCVLRDALSSPGSCVAPRLKERCRVGCCEWNMPGVCFSYQFGLDPTNKNEAYHVRDTQLVCKFFWEPLCGPPDDNTWAWMSPEEWPKVALCFYFPVPLMQALCAVDCVVGPVLVNGADYCLTACCGSTVCEQRLFSERHWSLWLPCCAATWPRDFQVGERVEVLRREHYWRCNVPPAFRPAKIKSVNDDGTYDIDYDDGGHVWVPGVSLDGGKGSKPRDRNNKNVPDMRIKRSMQLPPGSWLVTRRGSTIHISG